MAWRYPSTWPGHGPWNHLPPWRRPGWYMGRGWCWWYRPDYPLPPIGREEELRYLEEFKKYLTDVVLKDIDRRIEELKRSPP
ncbi:MAG: hypothetical protein QXP97_00120 [Desulfurococcus sp.]|uniref:hypothetical protein n=1 Tax=Desulfurococcus sp. TaxID=51678 RepID=UPI003164F96F